MPVLQLSILRLTGKNCCRISIRKGFLILSELLLSLLIFYLLMSVCAMTEGEVVTDRKIRFRIFASYFAEGITIESISAKGAGLSGKYEAAPCHLSELGSLLTDFQRMSFDRVLLPEVYIMRYTTSCPISDRVDTYHSDRVDTFHSDAVNAHNGETGDSACCNIVNTSVTWYEVGVERTVIVSASL